MLLFTGAIQALAEESPVSPTADMDYGTAAGRKLGRGLANLGFGWIEFFKGIEDVTEENNLIAGLTWGPIYGTGQAVRRTVAGAAEVVTFPVPGPNRFEPLVYPEFVMEDTRS